MSSSIKALIVVLFISAVIFRFAKPVALSFSNEADFARRRKVWYALTIVGFLSPSFWLFALAAAALLMWAGRKDTNPVALYVLLLHVVPPIGVNIPVVGINRLFSLDMYRLLSLFVLVPVAWKLRKSTQDATISRLRSMDVLLILYGAVQTLFYISPDTADAASLHDSFTNEIRRGLLFFLDAYLVYYVIGRTCASRRAVVEVLAYFCLAGSIMAALAIFENVRHWLLFEAVGLQWGGDLTPQFMERNGVVRAAVSAGHSLALGYLFAIALGFWLYLQGHVASVWLRRGVTMLFAGGLLAAYSRGPWVGAILICFAYVALGLRALPRLFKAAFTAALLALVLIASPLGNRITQVIPFMGGTVDDYNIDYRHRLASRSWDIIRENPWWGDSDAYSKLHDLRQGVGVIDFVNSYAEVAVFYGLTGLFFFVGFMLVGFGKTVRAARALRGIDPDLAGLGAAVAACILGTFLMIYTSSFVLAYEKVYYVLAGLAAAYVRVAAMRVADNARGSRAAAAASALLSMANTQRSKLP